MAKKKKSVEQGYTVGITIYVRPDGQLGLFENGLRQNTLFLYQLFKAAPNCKRVFLLNQGDAEVAEIPANIGVDAQDVVQLSAVKDTLDYVIGLGGALNREIVDELRGNGCKFVAYKGGNGAIISMEATAANPPRPDAERYTDREFFDAIWMTPQHIHTYRGWCETVYRRPVHEIPQIWAPTMIEAMTPPMRKKFNYKRVSDKWRIGVLDPNITVMKTSHMPMLVSEIAYRQKPEVFSNIYITNAWQFHDKPHFSSFITSLTSHKEGVMTAEPRFVGIEFMADHADAVVTHHWENGLNYLYYEVLYGDRPLIHNSKFIEDYGYYFPDFDAEAGAAELLRAVAEHDGHLAEYHKRNKVLFAKLDPTSAANIALHESLLTSIP